MEALLAHVEEHLRVVHNVSPFTATLRNWVVKNVKQV